MIFRNIFMLTYLIYHFCGNCYSSICAELSINNISFISQLSEISSQNCQKANTWWGKYFYIFDDLNTKQCIVFKWFSQTRSFLRYFVKVEGRIFKIRAPIFFCYLLSYFCYKVMMAQSPLFRHRFEEKGL